MSVDYELRLVTDWQPRQILEILSKELGLQWQENSRLLGRGIVLGATTEPEQRQSLMMEAFGFQPTVDIWFRVETNEEISPGKTILLKASLLLLGQIPGDGVLLVGEEKIVFQRIDGTLIFNKKLQVWADYELSELNVPYFGQLLRSPLISNHPPRVKMRNNIYTRLKSLATRQGKSMTELANEAIEVYLKQVGA